MRILILGGTYFIGRRFVEMFRGSGHDLILLNRGTRGWIFPDIEMIAADRSDRKRMKEVLSRRRFDIVIDFSGYGQTDIDTVIFALGKGLEQYIFISTAAVYALRPGVSPYREHDAKRRSPAGVKYGYEKRLAETRLEREHRTGRFNTTIIRPAYVYGPYDYSPELRLSYIFRRLITGQPLFIRGDGNNAVQFGYVDDLVRALIKTIANPAAFGETFNISGSDPVTVNDFIALVTGIMGRDAIVRHVSGNTAAEEGYLFLPDYDYTIDIGKAGKVLDFLPETSLAEGMNRTVHWWLENGGYSHRQEYDKKK